MCNVYIFFDQILIGYIRLGIYPFLMDLLFKLFVKLLIILLNTYILKFIS